MRLLRMICSILAESLLAKSRGLPLSNANVDVL
jgi:hypothetical protein